MKSKKVDLYCYGYTGTGVPCANEIVGRTSEPDRHGRYPTRCLEHGGDPDKQCVIDAFVDYKEDFSNDPRLHVLMHHRPEWSDDEPIWHQNGPLYYAEKDGIVHYHSYTKPDRGFGGAMYKGTLVDGTPFEHKGPWSSNAGAINMAGFGPIIDVSLAYWKGDTWDGTKTFEKGYTFTAGAITLPYVIEALEYCIQGVSLMWWGNTLLLFKNGERAQVYGNPPTPQEIKDSRGIELSEEQMRIVRG